VGFAIPVDALKFSVQSIIDIGRVVRPALGITYLDPNVALALGVASGVLLLNIASDSPAAAAGMKGTRRGDRGILALGDVIVDIDGVPSHKHAPLQLFE